MAWLRPEDAPDVAYEFFSPFAHVPGKYEWCRIRSPTHGAFDCFILLGASTSEPATVYVNDEAGEAFMRDRYPECRTIRVPPRQLWLCESKDGREACGGLRSNGGPVRKAKMTIAARKDAKPRNEPYGGQGKPVWGSARWTCWGVDLVLDAAAGGYVRWADGRKERLDGVPATLTLGSFARIAPLADGGTAGQRTTKNR